jgi:PBSX family phage portal protein
MDNNVIPFQPKGERTAPMVFSFGDPVPILTANIFDYTGSFLDLGGVHYNPPVSWSGLAKIRDANPYHSSIMGFKRNMICKWFESSPLLSHSAMREAANDFVTFENCYFRKIFNRLGGLVRLERRPAIAMRRQKQQGKYLELKTDGDPFSSNSAVNGIEYDTDEIIHLKSADVRQNIYGVPGYLGGIQSVLLSENATLFRRAFYINGGHLGYILSVVDSSLSEESAKEIEKMIKGSKGTGAGSSLFIHIPKTQNKDPLKVTPVGDIGQKDDFAKIKEATEQELLVMHRMRPELLGIIPKNSGGFADPEKTMQVYHELEVQPLQMIFQEVNEAIGKEAVKFRAPAWTQTVPPTA